MSRLMRMAARSRLRGEKPRRIKREESRGRRSMVTRAEPVAWETRSQVVWEMAQPKDSEAN